MNRVRATLIALAGSVTAGVGIVVGMLLPGESLHVSCPTDGSVCTVMARPHPSQCASLTRFGGDYLGPFEDGDEHALGRVLVALRAHDAIITWHAWPYINVNGAPDFSQCEVEVKLTREQAHEWSEALTTILPEDNLAEAPALLNTQPPEISLPRTALAGDDNDKPLEHFDLQENAPP